MPVLTGIQVAQLIVDIGVPEPWQITALAVAWAESGLNTDATGTNPGPRPGTVASRDRGLWQINDAAHPDVTDACAYDATCSSQAMMRISNGGTNWNPWTTYTNGSAANMVPAARLAFHLLAEGAGGGALPPDVQPGKTSASDVADTAAANIRAGMNPIVATAKMLQQFFDEVQDIRFPGQTKFGPIFGRWVE
jgi:hypothetical protein